MMDFLEILKSEIRPAVGCTEPIAVALAAAKAADILGKKPEQLIITLSKNVLKNGQSVGIPGTQLTGLDVAAAMGAIGGNSEAALQVLGNVAPEKVAEAENFYNKSCVKLLMHEKGPALFIKIEALAGSDKATVIISGAHTNYTLWQLNDKVLYQQELSEEQSAADQDHNGWSIASIYNFCMKADISDLAFLKEGIEMNWNIAEEGLKSEYGLQVGKTLANNEISRNDAATLAVAMAAAASDARMAGCPMPVMTTAGSGNQGLTAFIPSVVYARYLGVFDETLYRALALSILITIYIKRHVGKLSALCGCGIAAAIGSSAAITYLMGGQQKNVEYAIKNMIGDLSGLVCDGAKATCALKIATSLSSATRCALLASKGITIDRKEGIVDADVEKSIRNLAILGNDGMQDTDKTILNIMTGNIKA
jgi:L-cysteine desulfidase